MTGPVVLVNLLWLVPGRVGGSEDSVVTMLGALADELGAPGTPEVRLALTDAVAAAHPGLLERFPVETVRLDARSKVRRVLAEQTVLAGVARRCRAEVVHHAGGIVPLVHPGRPVLTVHDLQPLDLPQNFSPAKRGYVRAMVGRSARAAAVVCVPSRFTAGRVVELLGVPPERVVEVPWSVPPVAAGARTAGPPEVPGRPYFLWPAITYPHKNHVRLLEAFRRVVDRGADVDLVLTGGEGPSESEVRATVDRLGLADRVRRTGRLPRAELDDLYVAAAAVVVPSRYEGFGLPVLEAQLRGCPVVVAAAGSLPEVADAADLVDPDDVAGWAAAMLAVLDLPADERRARADRGRQLVGRWTPRRTALAQLDAYRRAAGTA